MRILHWTAAACFSLTMHLGLAGLYLSDDKTAVDIPTVSAGDGIEIGLDASDQPFDSQQAEGQQTEIVETAKTQPEVVEPQTPPTPEPEPIPAPTAPVEVAPQPLPELATVDAPAESENLVAVAEQEPAEPTAEPSSAIQQTPAPEASTINQGKQTSSRTTAGSGGKAGKGGKGGNPGAARDYLSDLMGWLRQHKQYPAELKKKKQQGVVEVKFSIDRSGELLSSAIHKTSGHPQLDAAALQMLADASPMPDIPDALDRKTLTLVIPVEYSLITN